MLEMVSFGNPGEAKTISFSGFLCTDESEPGRRIKELEDQLARAYKTIDAHMRGGGDAQ